MPSGIMRRSAIPPAPTTPQFESHAGLLRLTRSPALAYEVRLAARHRQLGRRPLAAHERFGNVQVLLGLVGAHRAQHDHVDRLAGAEHELQPGGRQHAAGGEGLDAHHRLLGLVDHPHHPVRLHVAEEADGVERLDVGGDVVAGGVGNTNRRRTMGAQARHHAVRTDALDQRLDAADHTLIDDQVVVGVGDVRHADGGAQVLAPVDVALEPLGVTLAGRGDVVDELPGAVLGDIERGANRITRRRHEGVDAAPGVDLDHVGHTVGREVLAQPAIPRPAVVRVTEELVGADDDA